MSNDTSLFNDGKLKYNLVLASLRRREHEKRERVKSLLSSPLGCSWVFHPRSSKTGVEFSGAGTVDNGSGCGLPDVAFRVDWLRLTWWGDFETFKIIYCNLLADDCGSWVDFEYGSRSYGKMYGARLGLRLQTEPRNLYMDHRQITIDIPGQACAFLGFERLQEFYLSLMVAGDRLSCSRIDLAFDQEIFSVQDCNKAVEDNAIRTLVKRTYKGGKTGFQFRSNPYQIRDNGQEGCATLEIGNRESTRFLRIYDKHGPTRLELELHDEKSTAVASELFNMPGCGEDLLQAVYARSLGHLRDFIDFERDFWEKFCDGISRAFAKLPQKDTKAIDAEQILNWIMRQVACAYSVALDVYGAETMSAVLEQGRFKRLRNKKYRIILGEGLNDAGL